jgi:hypothetical protein
VTDLTPEPNPYQALNRVRHLPRRAQRHLLRLEVWCEWNKCTPVRVFALRDGLLVHCRSDADVRDLQEEHPHLDDWSRRRAFFAEEWLKQPAEPPSHLQVVCDCLQTRPRLLDVGKMVAAIPPAGDKTRRVTLPDVAVSER